MQCPVPFSPSENQNFRLLQNQLYSPSGITVAELPSAFDSFRNTAFDQQTLHLFLNMEGTESTETSAKTIAKTLSETSATITADATAETLDLDHARPSVYLEARMECDICDWQYSSKAQQSGSMGRYSDQTSIQTAGEEIRSRLISIAKSHFISQNLLSRKQDLILKRWRGRTWKRRHAFIAGQFPHAGTDELWPNLACGKIRPGSEQQRPLRETIVRPILTTDKLLKSWTDLIALIHNRTVLGPRE
jgi:hypothetical protein